MAAIKSYTDIEQSKKLAEILPLESADMFWKNGVSYKYVQCFTPFVTDDYRSNVDCDYDVPCWSLAALLSIFDYYEINKFGDNIQFGAKGIALSTEENETLLDVVVNMIILLHKQNLL